MNDGPLESERVPQPAIWGLMRPDGSVDDRLVGTKGDCEVWVAAKSERQSGWRVVPLYTQPGHAGWAPEPDVLRNVADFLQERVTLEGGNFAQVALFLRLMADRPKAPPPSPAATLLSEMRDAVEKVSRSGFIASIDALVDGKKR
jgi:hypothetical protein